LDRDRKSPSDSPSGINDSAEEDRPVKDQISDRLHGIIENVQVIILLAELLKEEVGEDTDSRNTVADMIEQIIQRANENSQLVSEIRKVMKDLNGSKNK
jgi:methyl-accepting chemotaxis protein